MFANRTATSSASSIVDRSSTCASTSAVTCSRSGTSTSTSTGSAAAGDFEETSSIRASSSAIRRRNSRGSFAFARSTVSAIAFRNTSRSTGARAVRASIAAGSASGVADESNVHRGRIVARSSSPNAGEYSHASPSPSDASESITCAVARGSPFASIHDLIALRSFGPSSRWMISPSTCSSTFLFTVAGRCVTSVAPSPRERPSFTMSSPAPSSRPTVGSIPRGDCGNARSASSKTTCNGARFEWNSVSAKSAMNRIC
jgi:hypothetical protein